MVEEYRKNAIISRRVTFYAKASGRAPVMEFLDALPQDEAARVTGCLMSIETLGFDTPRVDFRQIKGRLWEVKLKTYRAGYRIFYVSITGENLVLLHVYKKQSMKAPKKEIKTAEKRMWEVLNDESAYLN